jgi:nitroimidazol reductase NimA-like FMN-containing flavoprotein (pyridoxamine 5'-phosphate oxidase superfamily)
MTAVTFSDKDARFLQFVRVGRLALHDGERIHVVPMCPVFADAVFYMATHGRTRKVRRLREDGAATLLLDQYSEDWMRNVGIMVSGTAEVIDRGPEFERGKALLEAKFHQYRTLFPIKVGESVVIRFRPTQSVTWDYAAGELNEPH